MYASLRWAGPVSGLVACVVAVGLGCQQKPSTPQSVDRPEYGVDPFVETQVVLEPGAVAQVLEQHLGAIDALAARTMLESEGYALVDTNSVVLVRQVYGTEVPAFETQSLGPDGPRRQFGQRRRRSDTIVWLAFENPTGDLANHTAVVIGRSEGQANTRLIELDIASGEPSVIREGKFQDGDWQPGDVGTDSFLACLGAGLVGSGWRCALTNCGWAHCMGIGASVSLVGCGAAWAFGAFD